MKMLKTSLIKENELIKHLFNLKTYKNSENKGNMINKEVYPYE